MCLQIIMLNTSIIVAVHGLGADPEYTWICRPDINDAKKNKPTHLLKDLIAKDDRFSNARILHFAYDSDWLVDACFESARDIDRRLLACLDSHRENRLRLPLIFVGHSFGGIVIKEALSISPDDSLKILEDTCGIIFLGTPHLGSPVAGFGATVAYLTGYLGSDTGLLLSLRSNADMLVNLSKSFQDCVKRKYDNMSKITRIISICERKPTYFLNWLYAGKIVPLQSATFGSNFMDVYEVDKDHSSLNKCATIEDPLYIELMEQLHNILPNEPPKLNRGQQEVIDLVRPFTAANAEFYPLLDNLYNKNSLECLPRTREDLLRHISDWLDDCAPTNKHLYWLQGKAGTGKSTIARTVVSRMVKKNYIVANFFFKRGEGDRARLKRFATTLAIQLVGKLPALAASVLGALRSDHSNIEELPLPLQFKKLIEEPMRQSGISTNKPIVIVIDALDECDSPNDVSILVQLLVQPILPQRDSRSSSPKLRVKYFLTSRLDHDIESAFNNLYDERWERKQPEEVTSNSTKQDIELYLRFQLENIKDLLSPLSKGCLWSNPEDVESLNRLVKLASPLFEFAATACRFIADSKIPGGPRDHLRDILESGVCENLDSIYLAILERRFRGLGGKYLSRALAQFQDVVVSIIILADSISIACFAALLAKREPDVRQELQHFESVLVIPPETDSHRPVTVFHESFRDFLVGPEAGREFKFDLKETHQRLLSRCYEILCGKQGQKDALHEDICNLGTPGTHRSEVSEETVRNFLTPELQYACRFWIYHLKRSGHMIKDNDRWHLFLLSHFLHWLEALSFLGRASESLLLVKELQTVVDACDGFELKAFLNDAERFILSFRPIIDAAPLQLYSSALTFAPTGSIIQKTFEACRPS
ncbi:Vegetative incompatibility HET-E-1-like protein [Cladobotryum mycophilum]|uniref:Vegetative incompatibility HET-E-1-like protein n=1 Tax=Cladobotryum mycophilum TaxID=491253 RepID=A0ABR0T0K6_9HYPO